MGYSVVTIPLTSGYHILREIHVDISNVVERRDEEEEMNCCQGCGRRPRVCGSPPFSSKPIYFD